MDTPLLCHNDVIDWLSIMMARGTMYVLSQVFTADMNVLGADQRRGALPGVVPLAAYLKHSDTPRSNSVMSEC